MTKEEFDFWSKAFLAAMQGCLAYSYCDPARGNYHVNCTVPDLAGQCGVYADAALAVWREKRRELVTVDLHAQRVRDDRSIAEGMDNGALQP